MIRKLLPLLALTLALAANLSANDSSNPALSSAGPSTGKKVEGSAGGYGRGNADAGVLSIDYSYKLFTPIDSKFAATSTEQLTATDKALCPVIDATEYPAWLPGCSTVLGRTGSGADCQAPLLESEPGQIVSYRFPSRLLVPNGDETGVMDFYEAPEGVLISMSNRPCSFDKGPCTRVGSRFNGIRYVGPKSRFTDSEAARVGACKLPASETGSNAYYVNVKMIDMKCQSAGSCAGQGGCGPGQLCYFLVYRNSSGGPVPSSPSTPPDAPRPGGGITCKDSNPDGPCYWQATYSVTNQAIPCAIPGFSPTHAACGCDPAATSQTKPGPLNASPCP